MMVVVMMLVLLLAAVGAAAAGAYDSSMGGTGDTGGAVGAVITGAFFPSISSQVSLMNFSSTTNHTSCCSAVEGLYR